MNKKQEAALKKLSSALERCCEVGLKGGVFDCAFFVWPSDVEHPAERPCSEFFEYILQVGGRADTRMILDGGAGV